MHSDNFVLLFLMRLINYTFIVLTITLREFDLGMSFGKVKSGKSLERSQKVSFYIQNCVGALQTSTMANCIIEAISLKPY